MQIIHTKTFVVQMLCFITLVFLVFIYYRPVDLIKNADNRIFEIVANHILHNNRAKLIFKTTYIIRKLRWYKKL